MANKMLIDAAHPEETRVVVLRGKRVEEFDYESAARKQLRGNIYLAKVTRVEPSLQAAFVDYGGNRHGFLAFSEIHPDYYQIPVADRQALLEEEAMAGADHDDDLDDFTPSLDAPFLDDDNYPETLDPADTDDTEDDDEDENTSSSISALEQRPKNVRRSRRHRSGRRRYSDRRRHSEQKPEQEHSDIEINSDVDALDVFALQTELLNDNKTVSKEEIEPKENLDDDLDISVSSDEEDQDTVESVGSEDALEEVPQRPRRRRRVYKIQEVIRRRQIILVQVVKEERGNKGAALTTYLSLAGRHTVLMPNTARGGGISRKITNPADRKRLRKIAGELEVPEGTGLIIRTAGASRTKAEIKRDYEYLLRLWENVRDLTMESTAPSVVYEEGDLIKRSIRDLYSKEIDEVIVAGEEAYKGAKVFMRMIMPSHAKNVKLYKDSEPLFIKHQIERQLNEMYSPYVTLPAGGYIVINQTEALVSIDVNSGKSTKEHSIEDTALRTNLEAAEEIARQLRLRDLAGLVVIDFIDMDERRNNRAVERKLKECLRNDRARIQVGRISHFGLLEMSRQRLRTGVLEGSTTQCPHCQGTGIIRSTDSVALSVLRALEDTLIAGEAEDLSAITSVDVALYVLNQKRAYLKDIEARYDVNVSIVADQKLQGANFQIERSEGDDSPGRDKNVVVKMDWGFEPPETKQHASKSEDDDSKKRRKRRRRRKDRNETAEAIEVSEMIGISPDSAIETVQDGDEADQVKLDEQSDDAENSEKRSRTRRRGRRGGRRHRSSSSVQKKDDVSTSEEIPQDNTQTEEPKNITDIPISESTKQAETERTPENASDGIEVSDSEEKKNRGRSRRRFPAGRRRSPRRRNNQDEASEQMEETLETKDQVKEVSENKPDASENKTEDKKTSRPRRPRVSNRNEPNKNTEPAQKSGADENIGTGQEKPDNKPVKTEAPISQLNGSAESKPAAPKRPEPVTTATEAVRTQSKESNTPTRKGWWQKRAQ